MPLYQQLERLHTLCCHRNREQLLARYTLEHHNEALGEKVCESILEARMCSVWLRKLAHLGHQFEPQVQEAERLLAVHAQNAVQDAIWQKDVERAKEWLRPGIALELAVYADVKHALNGQLDATLRKARADALRMGFLDMVTHMLNDDWDKAQRKFHALSFALPLDETDLEDRDDIMGTPCDVWRTYVKPLLEPGRLMGKISSWETSNLIADFDVQLDCNGKKKMRKSI